MWIKLSIFYSIFMYNDNTNTSIASWILFNIFSSREKKLRGGEGTPTQFKIPTPRPRETSTVCIGLHEVTAGEVFIVRTGSVLSGMYSYPKLTHFHISGLFLGLIRWDLILKLHNAKVKQTVALDWEKSRPSAYSQLRPDDKGQLLSYYCANAVVFDRYRGLYMTDFKIPRFWRTDFGRHVFLYFSIFSHVFSAITSHHATR